MTRDKARFPAVPNGLETVLVRHMHALLSPLCLIAAALAAPLPAAPPAAAPWVASWGAAQMVPGDKDQLPPIGAEGATLRQIVRLSIGGGAVRVRLSNLVGTQPLAIGAATVARAASPAAAAIAPGTVRPLRFAGRTAALVPPGAELYSDPVDLGVLPPAADLAVSLFLPRAPDRQTSHPGSRATSYLLPGNRTEAADLPEARRFDHWFQLADVEVQGAGATALVAIGDSITDGHGATTNGNDRWTDGLAARLQATPAGRRIGLVNAGIGGNRVLLDGLGPNLLARFDRDVIARAGVAQAIVLEGINDIGVLTRDHPVDAAAHRALVDGITGAFAQMAARAHAHGIRLYGATVMPFGGSDYYHPGPETENDRQAVNRFIRWSGTFDGLVDFDRAMRDPAHPDRLAPAFDSGDHLHPGPAGYRAMAAAVPLALLTGGATAAADGPALALSFDDIPAHGPLPAGTSRVQVIDSLIAALRAENVPAQGFFNAGFGKDDPDSAVVLAHWRAAGFPLGNHGYSHADLDKVGPAAFLADVGADEPALARLMAGQDWHWFRYPFLHDGQDRADGMGAVRAGLRARGYRIGAVTMDFGDWAYNEPYARCRAKNDAGGVAALEQSYLARAADDALRMRDLSHALYDRDIPYVLLMHVGAFDARLLPRLLAQYRAMGFRFVALPVAERDPFYASAVDLSRPGPSPSLERQAINHGLPLAPAAVPLPAATLCS
jgi:lysophospholipase L1-like esterase